MDEIIKMVKSTKDTRMYSRCQVGVAWTFGLTRFSIKSVLSVYDLEYRLNFDKDKVDL